MINVKAGLVIQRVSWPWNTNWYSYYIIVDLVRETGFKDSIGVSESEFLISHATLSVTCEFSHRTRKATRDLRLRGRRKMRKDDAATVGVQKTYYINKSSS